MFVTFIRVDIRVVWVRSRRHRILQNERITDVGVDGTSFDVKVNEVAECLGQKGIYVSLDDCNVLVLKIDQWSLNIELTLSLTYLVPVV